MKHQKKKKRSKASKTGRVGKAAPSSLEGDVKQGEKVVGSLLEASGSVSANEEPKKDGEVIVNLDEISEDRSTTSSSCFSSSEACMEDHCLQNGARQKCKMKKDIASAGTVSTLLGKDYMMSVPKKISSRMKGSNADFFSKEDAEQFLCSMFEEHCDLSFSALRDVLCEFHIL